MYLKLNDQISSAQITFSMKELVILESLGSKLFVEDKICEYVLPTLCNEEDSVSIVMCAKELREKLDTLVADSILTLPP